MECLGRNLKNIMMQKQLLMPFLEHKREYSSFSVKEVVSRIKKAEWRTSPYKYQNWGNWLHRMGAYVGKIKPAIAHLLIKAASKKGAVILDPFCGIGTVPLEVDLLKRVGIGIELNYYAYIISKAKFDRKKIDTHLMWLDTIKVDTSTIDLRHTSQFMRKFYDPQTLKEILFLINLLKRKRKYFLLGCLLGIIHGHRPSHLSAVTSLVIPYIPKGKPEYKEVMPRLKQKVRRMYRNGFSLETSSKIYFADARKMPLKSNSVDLVISSPPYFNTLDYVSDNKLRLEFLGYDEREKQKLKKELIQQKETYLNEMDIVGNELKRVIKNKGYCILVLGDLHQGKKITNTAYEVSKNYEKLGFEVHDTIDDAMPSNKCVPSKYKREKFDRILVMTNQK